MQHFKKNVAITTFHVRKALSNLCQVKNKGVLQFYRGIVERINLFLNQGNSYWQVNIIIRYDSMYSVEYAFEPFSSDETDGEIQLANIVVTEGQTVLQGDIIGYLYKIGDGAHVHFGMHKNGEFACPEPYFMQKARDSILNILHQIWPYAKMCYNQETPIFTHGPVGACESLFWERAFPR